MTIRDLLSDPQLDQKKILEKLLCHYADIQKEEIFTSYEKQLTKDQYDQIINGYNAYTKQKKPIEFILGFVEFFQRKFAVDSRCLIPRPETEYMIQSVNEYLQQNGPTNHNQPLIHGMDGPSSQRLEEQGESKRKNILIDVGTGCGVLGLSVLLENPGYFQEAFLTEYYADTLSLAKENTEAYNADLKPTPKLLQTDLVQFIHNEQYKNNIANWDITLVANLPYIPDETFDTQAEDNVKKREPRPAFVGGNDGLDFYRQMFAQLFELGKTGPITMFLEMMTRQVDILRKEFEEKIDFEEIKTFHFNIRIVKGVLKNK